MSRVKHTFSLALLSTALCIPAVHAADTSSTSHWATAWEAAPVFPNGSEITHATIRQNIRLSQGGEQIRIRVDNTRGTAPLVIGAATIAQPGKSAGTIAAQSAKPLTFNSKPSITLQPGQSYLSDPVDITTHQFDTISVDLFIARNTDLPASHPLGLATSWMSTTGNHVGQTSLPEAKPITARFFISAVDVKGDNDGTIVTFGDSITDGYGSTQDGHHNWPDMLAQRLAKAGLKYSIANAGISGNRILHDRPLSACGPSALTRFEHDALALPNVKTIILLEGINDIGIPASENLPEQEVSAEEIEAGIKELVTRAHQHGIRIIGATLTPFEGAAPHYYTTKGDATRHAVNQWIRTSGVYDGVIDFDNAVKDPANPAHIQAKFDHGDNLHMSDAGYGAMADSIDLKLLQP